MVVGQRIEQLLEQRDIGQSELARRVGLDPSTINALVRGGAHSSKHLHKIARELRTTPAYLSGETDDPQADAPEEQYTAGEREMIQIMRALDAKDRAALVQIGRSLAFGEQ